MHAMMEAEAGPSRRLQAAALDEQGDAEKPMMVRMKRKHNQHPIESLWLEVSERPTKRLEAELLAFSLKDPQVSNLGKALEGKQTRLLFHHVDTVTSFGKEAATRVNTLLKEYHSRSSTERRRNRERSKVDAHEKYLTTAREQHQALATKARFEQVWRSRKGVKKPDTLSELFHLYDIVRIDTETQTLEKQQREANAAENRLLQDFLPLFTEYLPSVAAEMANFATSSWTEKPGGEDEYVYDVYTLGDNAAGQEEDALDCPMIKVVDADDYAWGTSSESDYDSEDSNDERNPLNDYPEEEDESTEESGSNLSGSEVDEQKQSVHSDASSEGYGGGLLDESEDAWDSAGYDSSGEWR